jgi:hypothetical protein
VPQVWPSPTVTSDVEAVAVAPAQPEGDVSSAAGRAGTPVPRVARLELWSRMAWVASWAPRGVRPKSWAPRGVRSKSTKQATK